MSVKKKTPLKLWYVDQGQTWLVLLHFLLTQISHHPVTAQTIGSTVGPEDNKPVAAIMGIIAVMFLITGFLSLYSRKCTDRQSPVQHTIEIAIPTGGSSRRSHGEIHGLTQELIDTFPTFLYSDVKDLKIGTTHLACAVCLNEFEPQEPLRIIPKCSHVYHVTCINLWLASNSTCPLCRADLDSHPEETNMPPTFSIQIMDDREPCRNEEHENWRNCVHGSGVNTEHETIVEVVGDNEKQDNDVDLLCRFQSHPTRSKSTGFLSSLLSPPSNSICHSLVVQPGDNNCERFTLRLPDEVRSLMMNSTIKRTNSCVSFTRMSSGTWGYRTRSFSLMTPPNLNKNSCNKSMTKLHVQCSRACLDHSNVGERSSNIFSVGS